MVDDYMLYRVSDKIKKIMGIERFYDTKILIDTDDELPNNITLKNVMMLMTCVLKDGKFYPQIFLEKALFAKYVRHPTRRNRTAFY